MDALALLHRAQEVGLSIEPMGDKLLIRGPKCAESVVKLLAEHKAKVLAALTPELVHVHLRRSVRGRECHPSSPVARQARDAHR